MVDFLFLGGHVITLNSSREIIKNGGVAVDADQIVGVGTKEQIESEFSASEIIDSSNKIIIPGIIDGHAHAGHALVRGLGLHHDKWFQACEKIYAEGSSGDFWEAEAMLSALERIRFGTTSSIMFFGGGNSVMRLDNPRYSDLHCNAVKSSGIREILAIGPRRPPYPRKYINWDDGTPKENFVSFEEIIDNCNKLIKKWNTPKSKLIKITMMFPTPHPERNPITGDQLKELKYQSSKVKEICDKNDLLLSMDGHRHGTVKYCHEELGLLGPKSLLVHSLDLSAEDIEICKKTDSKIVHSVGSRAACRGRCPVPELIDTGVTVILATDAAGPDTSYDMFRQMFHCQHYHQFYYKNTSWMPPGKVLEMCTIDAAKCLGLEKEIGSIEIGKKADLVLVDAYKPHLWPLDMVVDRIASYANGSDVDTVMVDGNLLMKSKKVLTVDEDMVFAKALNEYESMLDRSGLRELSKYTKEIWGNSKLEYK
jgi:cytosine/adenosine deaminase-related metal-dependent hydrolase